MTEDRPWYAVYTKSRYEKKLAEKLKEKGIEAYVPLKKVVRQWSDRKKLVAEPLIRSYCFVRPQPGPRQYDEVLDTPGAVRFVWFSGKPAPIPNKQIDILRVVTGADVDVDVLPGTLIKGTMVRVTAGPLAGIFGELVEIAGRHRVQIKIDHLDQVLTISISPLLIEPYKNLSSAK